MTAPIEPPKFLKNIANGRVFRWSAIHAARADMIPCDAGGNVAPLSEVDAARAQTAQSRVKTKYLGSLKNGVLYNYSDILAERAEMVSINSIEEWERMRASGTAPSQAQPNTIVPTLSRSEPAPAPGSGKLNSPVPPAVAPQEVVAPVDEETVYVQMPDIEGKGARDAKTILSEWALSNFGQIIDRRDSLPVVLARCKALSKTQPAAKKAIGS